MFVYYKLGMCPAFATCAQVLAQNPHVISQGCQTYDECRAWLMFVSNRRDRRRSVAWALHAIGHPSSFVHGDTGEDPLFWDSFDSIDADTALRAVRRDARYLRDVLGQSVYVIPGVLTGYRRRS